MTIIISSVHLIKAVVVDRPSRKPHCLLEMKLYSVQLYDPSTHLIRYQIPTYTCHGQGCPFRNGFRSCCDQCDVRRLKS